MSKPLAATVGIGAYETATDPGTGFYSLQVPAGTYDLKITNADGSVTLIDPMPVAVSEPV